MNTPIHHRSWFPFVVAALTVSLVFLIAWTLGGKPPAPSSTTGTPQTSALPVTDSGYKSSASAITSGLLERLDAAPDDATRERLVSSALNGLLALIVPADLKDVHLQLAESLNLLEQGFAGDAAAAASGRSQLESILADNPWLK